jgi:hypothetical protein
MGSKNQSEVGVVSGTMELSDGISSVSFSPQITPGIRRPDQRTRGFNQYDSGMRQYWDAEGGQRHEFTLKNISKAKADKLNAWWQSLTILEFYADKDGAPATSIYARINPAGSRPFQYTFGQTIDTIYEAAITIVEVSSSSSA